MCNTTLISKKCAVYHYLCQQDHFPRAKRLLHVSTLNYGALLPTCYCSLEFCVWVFFRLFLLSFLLRAKNTLSVRNISAPNLTLRTTRESLSYTSRTCLFFPSLSRERPQQIQASYFLYNLRVTSAYQLEVRTRETIKIEWDIARLRPGGKTNRLGHFISGLAQFQMSQTI